MQDEASWHLDKRVPIALIVALAIQTGGAIWWASSINQRVVSNEASIVGLKSSRDADRIVASRQAVQLGRIEEQIAAMRSDLGRLIGVLENIQYSPRD